MVTSLTRYPIKPYPVFKSIHFEVPDFELEGGRACNKYVPCAVGMAGYVCALAHMGDGKSRSFRGICSSNPKVAAAADAAAAAL